MTKQTRRTYAKPAEVLAYCNLNSRIAVDKIDGIEIFLPVIPRQTFVAHRDGEPIIGHLDYVQSRLRREILFNGIWRL